MKIKGLYNVIVVVASIFCMMSCNKDGNIDYQDHESGLQYSILKDSAGECAKEGDYLTLHFMYKTSKDSTLRNTWKEGQPINVVLQTPSFKGGLEEGLKLLSLGDSAVFKLSADSLFAKTFMAPMPDFIDSGSHMTFFVKVLKIQDKAAFEADQAKMLENKQKEMAASMENQKGTDDKLLVEYISSKKINATKSKSGLYTAISKNGAGVNAKAGQFITVHYTGKLLDGTIFDSSVGKDPIEFQLGQGMVIAGWDEGLTNFNKGSKGSILIPSHLGYGPMPAGDKIPANSILIFDIEVVKIK